MAKALPGMILDIMGLNTYHFLSELAVCRFLFCSIFACFLIQLLS